MRRLVEAKVGVRAGVPHRDRRLHGSGAWKVGAVAAVSAIAAVSSAAGLAPTVNVDVAGLGSVKAVSACALASPALVAPPNLIAAPKAGVGALAAPKGDPPPPTVR